MSGVSVTTVSLLFFISFCLCQTIVLNDGWQLQTSAVLQDENANGEKISQSNYDASSWYPVTLPATVVAGLVQNNVYTDPFFGLHLLNINKTQFTPTWWFRGTFDVPSTTPIASIAAPVLRFKGLNYRANIWLNGHQIGNEQEIVGTFVYFEFDIKQHVQQENNVVAVQVYQPDNYWTTLATTDLAISFVDWAPYAPDSSMGIWREVELLLLPNYIKVQYPMVTTTLSADNSVAYLNVTTEIANFGASDITGILSGSIDGVGSFQQQVTIPAGSTFDYSMDYQQFPVLVVANPNLWWPWQMGEQYLYNLTLSFSSTANQQYDRINTTFGIRTVNSSLDAQNYRLYTVNGKNILIRGAGWAPDLFLRATKERHEAEMLYVRHMGLNAIRLEGKMNDDYFFDLANKLGILIMPGWCCCDSWQHWNEWKEEQYRIAVNSMRSQLKRLRINPSILVFFYSSDEMPPVRVETDYLNVAAEVSWPNQLLSSASNLTSTITGPTGVKMSGPYSYVPPVYWYNLVLGGAFAFLTEGGPGENPLTLESLQRTIPKEALWPINFEWDYHCGNQDGLFGSLDFFTPPLNARFGNAVSASDYLLKSQAMAYEGHRAMFEAYNKNKYTSTGVIQWMLNNAFPENIWHLYDYYLNPGGSYFGTKSANEPLHLTYSYNDSSIWLVNSLYEDYNSFVVYADIYNIDATNVYHYEQNVATVGADSTNYLFLLPIANLLPQLSYTYFLRLSLVSSVDGSYKANTTYWLSTQPDQITVADYLQSTFYMTPVSTYANYTELQYLPEVNVTTSFTVEKSANTTTYQVLVENPNNAIAFFVRLRFVDSNNNNLDILPVLWDDNYFTLLAYERRVINATFAASTIGNASPQLIVEVFNNLVGK